MTVSDKNRHTTYTLVSTYYKKQNMEACLYAIESLGLLATSFLVLRADISFSPAPRKIMGVPPDNNISGVLSIRRLICCICVYDTIHDNYKLQT